MSSCLLVLSSQLLVLSSSRFFVSSCLLVLSSCQFVMSSCLLGSISSRCSGKWAHTYPPKKWLDKDCRRNYHIKTESPSLIHRMAKWFRRRGDTRRNSRVLKEHDVLFDCLLWTFLLMIVVGEILHLQGSFQGALVLDNWVCYRCNRPCLHLTGTFNTLEILSGKSETFPFNLVRFRESASSNPQKTKSNIRRSKKINYMSECTEMYRRIFFTMYGNVLKKLFRKSFGWIRERLMQFWPK